jgi:heat shock 70kDa protein 1/2/6/8
MAPAKPPSWAVGIDIGTANTRVGVYRNNKFEIIPDEEGSRAMPTCVSFNDRQRLIGAAAKRQRTQNPANTVFGVMCLVGRSFGDAEVRVLMKRLPFTILDVGNQIVIRVSYLGEEKRFTPEQIIAMVLSRAKQNAEAYLGTPVSNVSLGVPAYFKSHQREAVCGAAQIAGLRVLHVLLQPTGASYSIASQSLLGYGERNCIFLDQGAGVFNVAVMTLEEGILEVKAIASDLELGGEDFVSRMVNHSIAHIKRIWKVDIQTNARSVQRLWKECERAMWQLSSSKSVDIHIDGLFEGRDYSAAITRDRFEELCQDLFRSTLQPIDRVLGDARIDKSQIHEILVLGGCSRIPRLRKYWSDYFNGKELNLSLNADEAQVHGAAVEAAIYTGDETSPPLLEILMLPVIPISISVELYGGMSHKLIPRNTTIPTKKSEIFMLGKMEDQRGRYLPPYLGPACRALCIFEGERVRTKDNRLLGKVPIDSILSHSDHLTCKLEVTIDITAHFHITVIVIDKENGSRTSMMITRALSVNSELMERLREAETEFVEVDEAESKRLHERGNLDAKLSVISELISTNPHATDMDPLSKSVEAIRSWTDENEFALVSEYRSRMHELDWIQAKFQRYQKGFIERLALWRQIEEIDELLGTSTTTQKSQDLQRETAAAKLWINTVPLEDYDRFSERRELLRTIIAAYNQDRPETVGHAEEAGNDKSSSTSFKARKEESHTMKPSAPTQSEPIPTATESMASDNGHSELSAVESFDNLFVQGRTAMYSDAKFDRIATYLRNNGHAEWCSNPRLYTVLRLMDRLDVFSSFLQQGLSDIWFPFSSATLPSTLSTEIQFLFLDTQSVVFSKGFQLEKDASRKHAHFSEEPTIFKVIGRLGRGAHGTVDKVMSVISHQEYARKRFRRTKGLRKEDVKTFITELSVLKRVHYKHCVELVRSSVSEDSQQPV